MPVHANENKNNLDQSVSPVLFTRKLIEIWTFYNYVSILTECRQFYDQHIDDISFTHLKNNKQNESDDKLLYFNPPC